MTVKKTLISLLLVMVLAVSLAVPAMAETTDACLQVGSAEELATAIGSYTFGTQYIQLTADITDPVEISTNLYLDLNGHDMTNVTISGGNLYAFDSTTGDYDCADDDDGETPSELSKVVEQEQKLPFDELCEEALGTLQTFYVRAKF